MTILFLIKHFWLRTFLSLIACSLLFLFHGEALLIASGEGTTVNFSNSAIGGNQPNATTAMPGTMTTQGATLDSVNNNYSPLLNNIINNFIQQGYSLPPNETASTSSIATTSDSIQKSPSIYKILQTPEPTDELMRPAPVNTLSESESLLPDAESYSITICLPYNDLIVPGCPDKKNASQASEKLAAMIMNKTFKSSDIRPLKIVMPSSMPSAQQYQLLCKIETGAIDIIESKSLKEGKKENKSIVIDIAKQARHEAEMGTNWSHNWRNDRSIHDFNMN